MKKICSKGFEMGEKFLARVDWVATRSIGELAPSVDPGYPYVRTLSKQAFGMKFHSRHSQGKKGGIYRTKEGHAELGGIA